MEETPDAGISKLDLRVIQRKAEVPLCPRGKPFCGDRGADYPVYFAH
jgi:hypothetical protein